MVIEEVLSQLPKSNDAIERAYRNCESQKRFITVKSEDFAAHLEKAKSDLSSARKDFEIGTWDWTIIKAYYSIHHALNALLINERKPLSLDRGKYRFPFVMLCFKKPPIKIGGSSRKHIIKFKGLFSKDHICTIFAICHNDILSPELYEKLRLIDAKFADFTGFDVTYALRKISQYDVYKWKTLTQKDARIVYNLAQEIVAFAEQMCYA